MKTSVRRVTVYDRGYCKFLDIRTDDGDLKSDLLMAVCKNGCMVIYSNRLALEILNDCIRLYQEVRDERSKITSMLDKVFGSRLGGLTEGANDLLRTSRLKYEIRNVLVYYHVSRIDRLSLCLRQKDLDDEERTHELLNLLRERCLLKRELRHTRRVRQETEEWIRPDSLK